MAYTTINKSTEHFNTKIYTGNASSRTISGIGFQPDLTWSKNRGNDDNNYLYDSVRGATKYLVSDSAGAEATASGITGWNADGYTLGSSNGINASGVTAVSWNWKAGTTGSGTTGGSGTSKAYSYSVNTTAGFSIVKYIGNGTNNHQIPHHLGAVPEMIIFKNEQNGYQWDTYHVSVGNAYRMYLDNNYNKASATNYLNSTTPTSTYINLGDAGHTNHNGSSHIAYCFTSKVGYCKISKYTGNGSSSNPPFIYTGFKPHFVITKPIDTNDSWQITDLVRDNAVGGGNGTGARLLADLYSTESTNATWASVHKYSNGFSPQHNDGITNGSGNPYLYIAFGQSLVGSNDIPCTAR